MQKIIKKGNSQLAYQVYGSGFSVVLIHGFGEDGRIWNNQVHYLQSNFQLIIPDLRGSGQSTLNSHSLSIESMADDVKKILDSENISQCMMFGHSMGGYITLAFAEKYVDRLKAFGLVHSTAFADSEEKKEARKKSIEFIKEHTAFEFVKATVPNLFSEKFREQQKETVAELTEQGKQFSKEALIAYYEAMIARPDRTAVLKSATVPVFFFIGEEDKAVNPADAITQTAMPSICSANIVSGIAHMGMLEAVDELNHAMEAFLSFTLSPKQ